MKQAILEKMNLWSLIWGKRVNWHFVVGFIRYSNHQHFHLSSRTLWLRESLTGIIVARNTWREMTWVEGHFRGMTRVKGIWLVDWDRMRNWSLKWMVFIMLEYNNRCKGRGLAPLPVRLISGRSTHARGEGFRRF